MISARSKILFVRSFRFKMPVANSLFRNGVRISVVCCFKLYTQMWSCLKFNLFKENYEVAKNIS